jgi:hypothetical protein
MSSVALNEGRYSAPCEDGDNNTPLGKPALLHCII